MCVFKIGLMSIFFKPNLSLEFADFCVQQGSPRLMQRLSAGAELSMICCQIFGGILGYRDWLPVRGFQFTG